MDYRRKRKSVVLQPSSGQQSWLLSEVKRLQKEVKKLKKENATLMHLNWKLQESKIIITSNLNALNITLFTAFPKMIDLLSGQAVHAVPAPLNTNSTIAVPRSGNEEPSSDKDNIPELCPTPRKSAKRTTGERIINTSSSSMVLIFKYHCSVINE